MRPAQHNTILASLLVLVFSLTGCGSPSYLPPPATPIPVRASFPSSLRPLKEGLKACTSSHPEIRLILNETPDNNIQDNDLVFYFGDPSNLPGYSAQIARDDILVIVNPGLDLKQLSTGELQNLFSGVTTNWEQAGASDRSVEAWVYPSGDPLRVIFDRYALANRPVTSQAFIAPDPSAMLDAISAHPGAIGYLPGAWLTDTVHNVNLEPQLIEALFQPVLALAEREPQGAARILLACLQSAQGQAVLQERYQP